MEARDTRRQALELGSRQVRRGIRGSQGRQCGTESRPRPEVGGTRQQCALLRGQRPRAVGEGLAQSVHRRGGEGHSGGAVGSTTGKSLADAANKGIHNLFHRQK